MGKFWGTVLPLNISRDFLPDQFKEFFVNKIEEIKHSFDPDRLVSTDSVEFSNTVFAEFQLVIEDFVKTVVKEMPPESCHLIIYPLFSYMIAWMKLFQLWPAS